MLEGRREQFAQIVVLESIQKQREHVPRTLVTVVSAASTPQHLALPQMLFVWTVQLANTPRPQEGFLYPFAQVVLLERIPQTREHVHRALAMIVLLESILLKKEIPES